jgi:hypothetical protein
MGAKLLSLSLAFVISSIIALSLALLSTALKIRTQHHLIDDQQRSIEKRQDEYKGQRSINRACADRHKAEKLELERQNTTLATENSQLRVYYKNRDAVDETEAKHLEDINADLTQRLVRLQRRDVGWQEEVASMRRDRETFKAQLGRENDFMVAWRTDAVEYKRLWQQEAERNKNCRQETPACTRVHYEDHNAEQRRENEKLATANADLRQRVSILQEREGRVEELGDRIQRERNSLRTKKEKPQRDVAHWEHEAAYWSNMSMRHEKAWRREVEKKRAAKDDDGAEV